MSNDYDALPKNAVLTLTDMSFSRFVTSSVIVRSDCYDDRLTNLHLHDFPQIWYCKSGEYAHFVNDSVHICGKGSIVIVPAGVAHGFSVKSKTELVSISFGICAYLCQSAEELASSLDLLFLQKAFSHEKKPYTVWTGDDLGGSISSIVESLIAAEGDAEALLLTERLLSLINPMSEGERKSTANLARGKLFPILRALEYINRRYAECVTVEDLLRVSAMCQTNFFKLFKAYTGLSSSAYLQRLRTLHAMHYMVQTDCTLQQISDFCGFSSPSHLIYCTHLHAGSVPKTLRAKLKEFFERGNGTVG